ncbi:MAG TPA: glycosyltransferase family 4 protein, partial [Clostridia bacterium]
MCVRNGINKDKISVIFNGVDPDYWGELPKSTLRSEFEIDENEFVILCVSRFDHDKGHRFLISSAAELKKMTKKRFRFVLANDGPLLEDCREYAESMGIQNSIIFTGFRKDVKNLIAGSDLYVNSSEHEALSFAIIEMLAAGLPVIATNMGGNDDIINSGTNCGILVEYNDSVGLAKTILKVMEDTELQSTLKRNALVAIREKFNLDNMVMKTYNLYMESK